MTIIDMGNDALAAQNRDESSMNSNLSHADTLLSDAEVTICKYKCLIISANTFVLRYLK